MSSKTGIASAPALLNSQICNESTWCNSAPKHDWFVQLWYRGRRTLARPCGVNCGKVTKTLWRRRPKDLRSMDPQLWAMHMSGFHLFQVELNLKMIQYFWVMCWVIHIPKLLSSYRISAPGDLVPLQVLAHSWEKATGCWPAECLFDPFRSAPTDANICCRAVVCQGLLIALWLLAQFSQQRKLHLPCNFSDLGISSSVPTKEMHCKRSSPGNWMARHLLKRRSFQAENCNQFPEMPFVKACYCFWWNTERIRACKFCL